MGESEGARLLPQVALRCFQLLSCLWLLCFCGIVLGSESDLGNFDLPLSHVANLDGCRTPTQKIELDHELKYLSCLQVHSVSALTGGEWSSLVKGGRVDAYCRHSTDSVVFLVRNYPSFEANPVKTLFSSIKTVADSKKSTMMLVEPLPKQCECVDGGTPHSGIAEVYRDGRVISVYVKSYLRQMHDILYEKTTCELPALPMAHPAPRGNKGPKLFEFQKLRKCFWRLLLPEDSTPVVRATRKDVRVYFEGLDSFDPGRRLQDPRGTLVLELPRACTMQSIEGEILVWVRQGDVQQEAEKKQQDSVKEMYVNIQPQPRATKHTTFHRFRSEDEFIEYYSWWKTAAPKVPRESERETQIE